MTQENPPPHPQKYDYLLLHRDGTVVKEPYLVLHCEDLCALPALDAYQRHMAYLGMPEESYAYEHFDKFVSYFRSRHYAIEEELKTPNSRELPPEPSPLVLEAMEGKIDFSGLCEVKSYPGRPLFDLEPGETALILTDEELSQLRSLIPPPLGGDNPVGGQNVDPYVKLRDLLGDDHED